MKRQPRLLHFEHDPREIHALVAGFVGICERSGLVLHGRDAIDRRLHEMREIRGLRDQRRRLGRDAGGARLQCAHLGKYLLNLHAAHGDQAVANWESGRRGTLMPAALSCCSLWRSVRGLMPSRSAASLRLPPVTRRVAKINSRSRSFKSWSKPISWAAAGAAGCATASAGVLISRSAELM